MGKLLKKVTKLWHDLSSVGVTGDLEASLRKRIITTNQISLTLSALGIVFFFFWLIHDEKVLVLVNAICAFLFYFLVRLNAKKHYYASRFFLMLALNIAMFIIVATAGREGGAFVTFYFLPSLGFLLFSSSEKKSLGFSILLPIVFFLVLISNDFRLFDLPYASTGSLSPYVFYYPNFIFILLSMFYLSHETQKTETELRSANERLNNSQTFLKSIIENLPLAFYTRDMENRYILVNSEFEKLFNLKKNEILFKTDSEILAKSNVDFLSLYDEEVYKSQSSKIFEAAIRSEGGEKTFLCTKFPILGPQQETFGICGIALDISERVAAQKQLDDQRALIIDNERLLALTDMANGMSHEINNPLAILQMIHTKLSRNLTTDTSSVEDVKETLNKMDSAVQRIGFIVTALRKFIEKPKYDRQESIDLKNLIDEILALSNQKIIQAGIELVIKTSGAPFNIIGQPSEIRQVIYNLLSNSFDALVNIPQGSITISTYYLKDNVRIMVQDSGPGIPKELESKLFQPFFTTKDVGAGKGLSLSVAKGIIHSHGGKLIYDSANELTTFVIELPREGIRALS
jgi:PAS domain S-box-containing protein